MSLARDRDLFARHQELSQSLLQISSSTDPIYRDVALERLEKHSSQISEIAGGTIVFEGTETWRLAYERLLRSPGLYQYRSVAWITTDNYWQDEPGRQSIRLNLQLHDAERVKIERIVIIHDELWPTNEQLPASTIRQWIHQQHVHGISVKLIRESQLAGETDLLADMGIYGSRAVGHQTIDQSGRTVQFNLRFGIEAVQQAEERWQRLEVYAVCYADLLDQVNQQE